jgi:hypothetical protein
MKVEPAHPAVSLNVQTLLDERHALKDRTAYQPSGTGQWIGPFKGARRGQGTEFDDLRHYSIGDDPRHIDWKASARTNIAHTRLYREEREYRTTIVLDMRDALFTGTKELQAVRLCRLAARLLWQANDGGSRTQVLIVTDDGIGLSESGPGHKSAISSCALMAQLFESIQSRLGSDNKGKNKSAARAAERADISPSNTTSVGAYTNSTLLFLPKRRHTSGYETVHLEQVVEWMLQQSSKHTTAFWVSAFDHCGKNFDDNINMLSQKSSQIAIVVDDDIMSTGLPTGRYHYQSQGHGLNSGIHSSKKETRIATLSRKSANRLRETLYQIKNKRDERIRNLMMPSFHLEQYGENLISSLRHQGFLP